MKKGICLFAVLILLFQAAVLPAFAAGYEDDTIVGTAATLIKATNENGNLVEEMPLCDVAADAARTACGTDVAILNGGDFIANLDGGAVTMFALQSLFAEDRALVTAEITGTELLALLEYGVSRAVTDVSTETLDRAESAFGGFPQVSGITFTYDPTAPAGERILYPKLSDRTEITSDMTLTVTATAYMLDGGYGYPETGSEETCYTLVSSLAEYFGGGEISAPETDRIDCIGVSDYFSFSRPLIFLVAVAAVIIALSMGRLAAAFKKRREVDDDII